MAVENRHLWLIYPLKIVIFHSFCMFTRGWIPFNHDFSRIFSNQPRSPALARAQKGPPFAASPPKSWKCNASGWPWGSTGARRRWKLKSQCHWLKNLEKLGKIRKFLAWNHYDSCFGYIRQFRKIYLKFGTNFSKKCLEKAIKCWSQCHDDLKSSACIICCKHEEFDCCLIRMLPSNMGI